MEKACAAALDAVIRVQGPKGEREIPFAEFHRLPGDTPERETNLAPEELITAVDLPAHPWAARSHYVKVSDRASYAFALVSVAAALDVENGGRIKAARVLHENLAKLAVTDVRSPLHGIAVAEITLTAPGRLGMKGGASKSDAFAEILRRSGKEFLEGEGGVKSSKGEEPLAFQSFGAHFCEVKIDPAMPRVQVTRFVAVMDCGRVMNVKTARSQILGIVVMGIGMALEEATIYDPATGLSVTRNLADYHVPVKADIPDLEVHFVGEPDFAFTPMGARGLGEIGNTGTAAAVAKAVFHATGRRVRDLPITPDKLM